MCMDSTSDPIDCKSKQQHCSDVCANKTQQECICVNADEPTTCDNDKYYQSWNRASMYLFLCGEESLLVDTGTGIVICYICHILHI